MDSVTKHPDAERLRERIEAVLRENVTWAASANPARIIDLLVGAVGEVAHHQVMVMTCSTHGEIAREDVWCEHDTQEVLRRVATAHGASYGANCKEATLNVELLNP